MVSAAKLRRAQDRVIAARPYAQIMERMLKNVAQAASRIPDTADNPLLARREEKRISPAGHHGRSGTGRRVQRQRDQGGPEIHRRAP